MVFSTGTNALFGKGEGWGGQSKLNDDDLHFFGAWPHCRSLQMIAAQRTEGLPLWMIMHRSRHLERQPHPSISLSAHRFADTFRAQLATFVKKMLQTVLICKSRCSCVGLKVHQVKIRT